jgi:hypothetical protein
MVVYKSFKLICLKHCEFPFFLHVASELCGYTFDHGPNSHIFNNIHQSFYHGFISFKFGTIYQRFGHDFFKELTLFTNKVVNDLFHKIFLSYFSFSYHNFRKK